jgi:beta-N-acetylhexosaminidase
MKNYLRAILFIPLLASSLCSQLLKPDTVWVEKLLGELTLEEKIGQMFMPVYRDLDQAKELVQQFHVGGLWFARTEAKKIAADLNVLQQCSTVPLLISVDFEKGAGTYVDGATDLPINMALGASRDPMIVLRAASMTAKEARAIGVHINFAPVMDVNNNAANPIINTRSYGEDPSLVATMAKAAIEGYQNNGLLATGKHFPGHGNTSTDSHASLGTVESSAEELEKIELYPYKAVLESTPPSSIMSAHLWMKAIDKEPVPATLSPKVMTELLRNRLGFKGLLFTDAMEMGGITKNYTYDDAVVKAILAGCDIILFPVHTDKGIAAIKKAVEDGTISQERIDQSVKRILIAKTLVGLQSNRMVDIDKISSIVGIPQHYAAAKEISAACITLVKDSLSILPIQEKKNIGLLTIFNSDKATMTSRDITNFPDEISKLASSVIYKKIPVQFSDKDIEDALEIAKQSDIVVIGAYIRIVLASGTVELPQNLMELINKIRVTNPNIVLVSFGNPYIIKSLPGISTYVCCYDNAQAMQETASEALFGKVKFKGILPVTISKEFPYGAGITGK